MPQAPGDHPGCAWKGNREQRAGQHLLEPLPCSGPCAHRARVGPQGQGEQPGPRLPLTPARGVGADRGIISLGRDRALLCQMECLQPSEPLLWWVPPQGIKTEHCPDHGHQNSSNPAVGSFHYLLLHPCLPYFVLLLYLNRKEPKELHPPCLLQFNCWKITESLRLESTSEVTESSL